MIQRKKILITIDWFLPGTKSGGPVRSYANMIAHLSHEFDFYVITRDTDYCSDEVYKEVLSNQWNRLDSGASVYYISKDQLKKSTLQKLFDETDFDYVLVNGIYSMYFSILPVMLLRQSTKVIVSARGMLNPQAFSVKPIKKKVFLMAARLFKLYKNVKFHATNVEEAQHIKKAIGTSATVMVAPNLPRKSPHTTVQKTNVHSPVRYVNIARISVEKGTLKMLKAMRRIKTPVILDVFGPIYDESYWKTCQAEIERMPDNVVVDYKGVLKGADVMETLKSYDFFVLLSEGENFGHAILEALSVGCPVIISNKTPWNDLETKGIGWDVDLNISEAVDRAFEVSSTIDSQNYSQLSKNAFNFAKEFSQNPKLITANKNLFDHPDNNE